MKNDQEITDSDDTASDGQPEQSKQEYNPENGDLPPELVMVVLNDYFGTWPNQFSGD